ncbi:MAG: aspartate kinase [Chlamydiia bacterium]|nr:aspartate kinase [Chlamydiia bacterium]
MKTENSKTVVLKFGGSALKTPDCFAKVSDLIIRKQMHFSNIVVVVSAMRGMTDELISLAYKVHPFPPKREYDMLVSAGERISIALLAMSLASKGVPAVSFTGSQSGIITTCDHTDAQIVSVSPQRILISLEEGKVVIVAGFQGMSEKKEITTLGRGGSDTTAVALAGAVGASHVEFYKDVPGIYREDCVILSSLTYEEALEVVAKTGGQVVAPRAIKFAQQRDIPLYVRSFFLEDQGGTKISNHVEGQNNENKQNYNALCRSG